MKEIFLLIAICIFSANALSAQQFQKQANKTTTKKGAISFYDKKQILPGACQTNEYLPLLKGKRVGIFANNTATIGKIHLADTLLKLGVTIAKIFGPEHGFRGTANAGEKVDNYTDPQTGIPVISLYGKKENPQEKIWQTSIYCCLTYRMSE